jgi:hypothetical protein
MSARFPDMAKSAFAFLDDAGFRLVHCEQRALRYETAQVFVAIEWDARSGELNVYLGLQPKNGERADAFSLDDLLGMEQMGRPSRSMPFQVADESRLEPFLKELATEMRAHAVPALDGDRMYFRRLETYRHAQSQAYMRGMKLRHIRAEAAKAWSERNYAEVARLYALIEHDLSESERGKLAYARQHPRQ